jgi:sulfite reductase alpha subunit-like flavoprotein
MEFLSQAHPGQVQLLIALVDYKTNLKIRRRGLLSSWLRDLELDSRIPLRIEPPTLFLPQTKGTPVILVGPGTGVAPMRAFVEERIAKGEARGTLRDFDGSSLSLVLTLYGLQTQHYISAAEVRTRICISLERWRHGKRPVSTSEWPAREIR